MNYLIIILLIVLIGLCSFVLYKQFNDVGSNYSDTANLEQGIKGMSETLNHNIMCLDNRMNTYQNDVKTLKNDIDTTITKTLLNSFNGLNSNISDGFERNLKGNVELLNERLDKLISYNDKKLEQIDKNVNDKLENINKNVGEKLDIIDNNVNQKLERSINTRLEESFKNIFENMHLINKGIGEIKNIATDVSDLKSVLTNVKTKGVIGEVMLENILSETLTEEMYVKNYKPYPTKSEVVEFAVKIKNLNNDITYLPIDSKFPLTHYHRIVEAVENCNKTQLQEARKTLFTEIRKFAKDISSKYINVPTTTNYGIMFLPIEGLYAEVINSELFNEIREKYNIVIASPSTLTALLNSLMIGFKTITIAKKSEEVFKVLNMVKEEFKKFDKALNDSIKALDTTRQKLDDVVGVRTRQLIRQLDKIGLADSLEENTADLNV